MTDPDNKAPELKAPCKEVPRARLHLIAQIPAEHVPRFFVERTSDDHGPVLRVYVERAA